MDAGTSNITLTRRHKLGVTTHACWSSCQIRGCRETTKTKHKRSRSMP